MRCFTLLGGLMLALLCMAPTTVTKPTHITVNASSGACPVTVGTLTLNVTMPRSAGISPLMVFYDATASTDSANIDTNMTVFQDVQFNWNFGDSGASGTSTWAYGARPNTNSRNTATGGVAAHLYQTQGADTAYTTTVTATDGVNTASCTVTATAFDPTTVNGFSGATTTCVSSSGTPVAGSGGCPASATVLNTASVATALTGSRSGKRTLFKCGDTFTATNVNVAGVSWSIGAYGGCENTTISRPIFNSASATTSALIVSPTAGDGRIADIDFEGAGTGAEAVNENGTVINIPYQVTLYNLKSNGNAGSYAYAQGAQWALIGLVQTGAAASSIATFMNYAENNPCNPGGSSTNCNGFGSSNPFNNVNYQALMGSSLVGVGTTGASGVETARISACRMCVVENNTITNANSIGAVLKFHSGNTFNSCTPGTCTCTVPTFATTTCFTGVYSEYLVISDNFFGGFSGSNLVELSPENAQADERTRIAVVTRNIFSATTGVPDGRDLLLSAVNVSVRDNIFYTASTDVNPPFYGVQIAQRGVEPVSQFNEIYNNTCYFLVTQSGQACIGFDGVNFTAAGTNSLAKNNLFYGNVSHPTVVNNGAGNTVASNTVTNTLNPAITNGSGAFSVLSDFKPTANYTGGVSVPVVYDALAVVWSPTWDLGAVKH